MKKTRKIHFSLDIDGALKRPKDFVNCIQVDGKILGTTQEVRAFLVEQKAMGRRVLPMGDCDDFDYQTGCRGHIVEEDDQ